MFPEHLIQKVWENPWVLVTNAVTFPDELIVISCYDGKSDSHPVAFNEQSVMIPI